MLSAALVFVFSACGGKNESPAEQPQKEQSAAVQETEKAETAPESETSDSAGENTASHDTEPSAETSDQTAFDAENAVVIEQISNGVKYTFNTLPQTAADIAALADRYTLADRHNTAAFFMVSLVRYIDDAEEGLAMIDVLKGPQPLSDAEKAFIKERFSDKKYLPRAYFEGAAPENNYQPDSPWTVLISDEAVSAPEGYSYVTVSTLGADSPRRICMRIKGDSHYLWEYNGVLLSIRKPAEEDPWL